MSWNYNFNFIDIDTATGRRDLVGFGNPTWNTQWEKFKLPVYRALDTGYVFLPRYIDSLCIFLHSELDWSVASTCSALSLIYHNVKLRDKWKVISALVCNHMGQDTFVDVKGLASCSGELLQDLRVMGFKDIKYKDQK